jgi:hypothetical protein
MAHAYTPGLQVTQETVVRKDRLLPIAGEVLVAKGDRVDADTVVARTELPSDVATVNVVNLLGITPEEIEQYMLKKEGDLIEEGDVIAENKPLFGLKILKTEVKSPIKGRVENISNVTGQILLRKPPRHIELDAYVQGAVVDVHEGAGVTVETVASYIQGIFGIGGERKGELVVVVDGPEQPLTPDLIREEHQGKIVVGGSLVEWPALKKATEVGIRGVIGGGFQSRFIKEWLGYEIGVAITGDEEVKTTLILTEGFGRISMARRTFDLLKASEGKLASISGRTQIRAGVMRPEVIIPLGRDKMQAGAISGFEGGVKKGDEVRIIREPYFGRLGRVKALTPQPVVVESEAKVRVMEVDLDGGETVTVPRANVELIES